MTISLDQMREAVQQFHKLINHPPKKEKERQAKADAIIGTDFIVTELDLNDQEHKMQRQAFIRTLHINQGEKVRVQIFDIKSDPDDPTAAITVEQVKFRHLSCQTKRCVKAQTSVTYIFKKESSAVKIISIDISPHSNVLEKIKLSKRCKKLVEIHPCCLRAAFSENKIPPSVRHLIPSETAMKEKTHALAEQLFNPSVQKTAADKLFTKDFMTRIVYSGGSSCLYPAIVLINKCQADAISLIESTITINYPFVKWTFTLEVSHKECAQETCLKVKYLALLSFIKEKDQVKITKLECGKPGEIMYKNQHCETPFLPLN